MKLNVSNGQMRNKNNISKEDGSRKNEILEEMELLAPALAKIEKLHAPQAPDGYFDRLPGILQDRINRQQKEYSPQVRLLNPSTFAIAAGIILIGISLIVFNFYKDKPKTEIAMLQSSNSISDIMEIEEYYNMDEELIVEALVNTTRLRRTEKDSLNFEEEINYLLDNNIELSTIINELI